MDGLPRGTRRQAALFGLGLFLAAQASKYWILFGVFGLQAPRLGDWAPPIPVTGFFNLVLVWNTGISFGLFNTGQETTRWILIGLTGAISVALAIWLTRAHRPFIAFAVAAVLGGAIGNLLDRLIFGAVVDFLDFHVAGFHWPAFNLADSAIVLGVAALVIDSIFGPDRDRR